jgi:uncharacterized protein YukE
MKSMRFTFSEIEYAAAEFQNKGRTFKDIAHELGRSNDSLRRHVWKYLSEREYRV